MTNAGVRKSFAKTGSGILYSAVGVEDNCIGAFEVPDRRRIPEEDILLETRKGVALSYAPAGIAV